MPVVLTLRGVSVTIYTNDHRPAHVHAKGAGREAVFNLNCPVGPVELRENYEFSHAALNKLAKQLQAQLHVLCSKWRDLHGNY